MQLLARDLAVAGVDHRARGRRAALRRLGPHPGERTCGLGHGGLAGEAESSGGCKQAAAIDRRLGHGASLAGDP